MKFLLVLSVLLLPSAVSSHEWYPQQCCSNKDCYPVPCEKIHSQGDKWEYYGQTIDKFKTQLSPDGACHICVNPLIGILCIFLGGTS